MKVSQPFCQTTGGVSALLHLQSAPRKCEVISWGYNSDTPSGRRDILATTMLCVLLVSTAFAINGFTSAMELVNVQTELCDAQDAKLADNRALMHNVTNYTAAFNATSYRVNLANDAFVSANYTYNRLRTAYTWPEAYELSEDDRQVGRFGLNSTTFTRWGMRSSLLMMIKRAMTKPGRTLQELKNTQGRYAEDSDELTLPK